jgi:hypothetical protein
MEGPNEEAEASISTANEEEDPNLNPTVAVRRKAAKRTLPWDLSAGELDLVSPPQPQAEVLPATKKQRLGDPISVSTDEAAKKLSSHDTTSVSLPAAGIDIDDADNVDAYPVKGTRAINWTSEEDANLSSAVTSTCKTKVGKEYRIDFAAVAALAPDRTKEQCKDRWRYLLDPNNDQWSESTAKWADDEDSKLMDAVHRYGGKDWAAISVLVPGRTTSQCWDRWRNVLDPSIDRANGCMGKWTAVEDNQLRYAVRTHGDKNWGPIAALIPGRAAQQCRHRWHTALDPNRLNGRTRKGADDDSKLRNTVQTGWAEDEDSKLRYAVQPHGVKNWGAIATLVPGRTTGQCWDRWRNVLDPSIDRANGCTGKWTAVEDNQLRYAVRTHGDRNWGPIAALIPGRVAQQCRHRWYIALDPNRVNGRTGKGAEDDDSKLRYVVQMRWAEDEDSKLRDAVQRYGGKKWDAIATLVPNRTTGQCRHRWNYSLNPSIHQSNGRTGTWAEDEDIKLKAAVQTHGGKDWAAIAALVPGRRTGQCRNRWRNVLNPNIDRVNGRTGKWTAAEDGQLKDAVKAHGDHNWGPIAALVPGRVVIQCRHRWLSALDPKRGNRRTGKWAEDEDSQLRYAVQTHGVKNWGAVATLVPGRGEKQCLSRWHNVLDPSIDRSSGRAGKWVEDEDKKLKDAVQTHGGNNWAAVATLVPGRGEKQCWSRWHNVLDPSIDRSSGRAGKWVEDEDIKLKDAVQTHGRNNWAAVAALVPNRTKPQCKNRWHSALHPNIDRANGRTGV